MTTYSDADAKNRLPSPSDKALEGAEIVTARHGRPVVELYPRRQIDPQAARAATERFLSRRHKDVGITSVELLNEMYDEADDR